jgi:hypothetical protein
MSRHNYIQLRFSDEELSAYESAAQKVGMTRAAWMRAVLNSHVDDPRQRGERDLARGDLEKAPVEFETVLKEEAKGYNLAEDKLREEIGKELYARVAREIVEKIIAGEVKYPAGAMEFRVSPYIDFNSGTVIIQPMDLLGERKPPLSLDDMLDLFECRVDVWQLGPAVEILKKIEAQKPFSSSVWAHTAYALLAVVFTYFEMIGKSLNPGSKPQGSASIDFNYGFCDVYPVFDINSKDVKEFRDRVRNGLYHLGYTKGNLGIHNQPRQIPDDFFVYRSEPEPHYLVNPHQVTRTIVAHFPEFMARLRAQDDMRERFRRFFTEYHGLR